MIPETGRRFGPYEIQNRLGGGGMGHVFSAWDARLHREVAIKLLNHEYAMPGMRERFLREARAASALNHPNICTIFDIGEQDGDPYLVMELLHGETLRDRILNRTVQVDEMIAIARDSAEALGAAHAKGVIHRDIKPANIFLVDRPNGGSQAKILDFGLAKIEGGALGVRSRSLELTTAGATVGTLAYMSPEQARGEVLDSRSDLFSLGVVMYEMATRRVPFQGATSALVFVQLLSHAPEPVRDWNESIPRELEKIIFKLLAKDRSARFQTSRELELALMALNEKGSGGGWLRKAVATVPLVRATDPVARDRRLRSPYSKAEGPSSQVRPAPVGTAWGPSADDSSRPPARSSEQILRPIARIPSGDPSSRPPGATPIPAGSAAKSASGNMAEGIGTLGYAVEAVDAAPASAQAGGRSTGGGRSTQPLAPEPEETVEDGSGGESTPTWDVDQETGEDVAQPLESAREKRFPRALRQPVWISVLGLAVAVAAIAFYVESHSHSPAVLLHRGDTVVVTEIENLTGDRLLDGSVATALRVALAQSPYLRLRSDDSYLAARHAVVLAAAEPGQLKGLLPARLTAERLGARAYVYGAITGTSAPYLLQVELRDVQSNAILMSAEAHAESLQQFPDAIDQIATELRLGSGEQHASFDASSVPISREGTASLAAWQLFNQAQGLVFTHEPVAAVADLQQAVTLDPKFVQAYLSLTAVFHQLRAETAASDSARLAAAASDGSGERTRNLAQATYELETNGDLPRAAEVLHHLVSRYPHDAEALTMLAETLLREGHMAEALQDAQQAYAEDPFQSAAYFEAERALIGLDRYDAAYQLDTQVQRLGIAHSGDTLVAAFLDAEQGVVDDIAANMSEGKMEYRPDWAYGMYLDNQGHLAAGAALWRSRAAAASQTESLKSAGALLLSQGALNRALVEDCSDALSLAHEVEVTAEPRPGRAALFNLGMADALCGDGARGREMILRLQQQYPQSFDVSSFFVADIQAAIDLRTGDPAAALEVLQPARAFDLISLTPYLRGLAHLQLHQVEIAIVDFQSVLAHRGLTFLAGNDVYPAAQIGVARAFGVSGDTSNSVEAYRKFLDLWKTADPSQSLLTEARGHAGE
jgi:serine/threonine protein kinase/tetratricopeptide (TPR) repeat protein